MKKDIFRISLLIFCSLFATNIFGQANASLPIPQTTPPVSNDENVVKISTTLIQLDVIVTDKKGNQVTNLKPEDFEIYENGDKQNISNFSYIFAGNSSPETPSQNALKSSDKTAVPIPPITLKPEQVRRTYAIVVDDLGLSFENVSWVQQSLKKFINEQMQEGDLVAVIRTGSGIGALQSFTGDKRLLLSAVNKIRWNPQGRGGISSFEPLNPSSTGDLAKQDVHEGKDKDDADKDTQDQIDEFRNENFSIGTLGALNYIIRGMRELPGRKSLMIISEGVPMLSSGGDIQKMSRVYNEIRLLADLANRSSVVLYTIDPRGLVNPAAATAEDNIGNNANIDNFGPGSDTIRENLDKRNADFIDTQQSLRYLAYETGGFPFINQNDVGTGLRRILKDQNGYYLIGYQPDSDTFDPKKNKFNKLTVKVKDPNLRVRYRSGFYGVTDERIAQVKQTKEQQIYSALTSPFGSNAITLNLYAVSGNDTKSGNYIRSLVYIDAKDLQFTKDADGSRRANFDIIAMTFGDNGAPVDNFSKNYTIRVGEKVYQNLLDKGFVYDLPIPIKKAGAYQFRIALRDSASEKIGSVSQFVEVPDVKKGISISKIVLNGFSNEQWQAISTGQSTPNQKTTGEFYTDAVLRKFKRGNVLQYDSIIYNAQPETLQKSEIQIQVRLFRDSNLILESTPAPLNVSGQADLRRIETTGSITLGKNLQPGNYIMQMVISDTTNKSKPRISTQFVEFEIVE